MQRLDGRYVHSATDLNNYLECRHLTGLSRAVADGVLERPLVVDETAALVKRKGDEHEKAQLDAFVIAYGSRVARLDARANNSLAGLHAAEVRTRDAMASGAQIIYQATFFDGLFVGHADFLRRVEVPCAHWGWSYEVLDTKLALAPKPYFLIQLCNYSEHLERVQGRAPDDGYVIFGDGAQRGFRIADYAAYYRHLKASYVRAVGSAGDAYPVPVGHCGVCDWSPRCEARREGDDYLGLVAGIRAEQIAKLETGGVSTMRALATSAGRPQRMAETTYRTLRVQAELQVEQRDLIAAQSPYPYRYRFRPVEPDPGEGRRETAGFAKLPPPANGDVFFDIEGDPLYRPDRGLEYLFGLYLPDEDRYVAFWARDASEERAAFERCVDFIAARRKRFADMHVYHYASYERTALGRLMGTFASRENDVDAFFTIGLFVDLFPVVTQALWLSQPSYSLKKVEKFYGFERTTHTKGGDDSIVMFEAWLATGDDGILRDIERYNEDDCRSTYLLRQWLLERRAEYNARAAEPIGWRAVQIAAEPPAAQERTELEARLLAGIDVTPQTPAELDALAPAQRERWLLGNMLQYHRRENKPQYWEYFRRCESIEDLVEFDRKAIGGLVRTATEPYKNGPGRNLTYEFTYPEQEHDVSGKPHCPDSRAAVTEIASHDDSARRIALRLPQAMAATIRALIPATPLPHGPRQQGVVRIANALVAGTLSTAHPATYALLRNDVSRLRDRPVGARIQPHVVDEHSLTAAIDALDASYLIVQGPPGTGKSTFGAAAIVTMLRAGKRVGLMANGHKALHGLLAKIEANAARSGVRFDGAHKMSETENSDYRSTLGVPMIRNENKVSAVRDAQLVSGTGYFWPDEAVTGAFDAIVIDEAGQVSLADALIASMAARNVVLLGDPRQLPQVSQGSHPVGAGVSILQHLLGDRDTVAPERGVFLDVSYRMQPAIAAFVSNTSYEGRLRAADSTRANRVDSRGLCGGGLRYLPVRHAGNGRDSIQEAERIVDEIASLVGGTFVREGRPAAPIDETHVLVVAPYNRQRRLLIDRLAARGLRRVAVGTVDKFQGQEAPVVFYSMATSSDEDMPRDMNFLFDRNRFNVAISRAQCLSVLVCSPDLLDARCRNPEQMQLVNLLCAFAQEADSAHQPAVHAATG